MKKIIFRLILICAVALLPAALGPVTAAAATASLLDAQKKAEAQGFIFESDHQEIVTKAKKEGKVKFFSGLDADVYPHMVASFKKKHPSIDVEMHEITGPDAARRFVLEMKAGGAIDFDSAHASTDFYPEYPPFAKKFDILGMAQSGVLRAREKIAQSI